MHLLFWLSLVPFASGWMGENNFDKWPAILYGIILLMCGLAYYNLSRHSSFSHKCCCAAVFTGLVKVAGSHSIKQKVFAKYQSGIVLVEKPTNNL
jgi:hypothetical protein